MAGSNETPRQKMIGMMYLVLTALLALNVSKSVLEKFVFINSTLEKTVAEGQSKNSETLASIEKQVDESGNRPKDVAVMKKAQEIRKKTGEVLKELDAYKEEIIAVTGGRDEDGNFMDVSNEEKVANLLIKGKQPKADDMKELINGYTSYLSEASGIKFPALALDAKDNPVFAKDKNQNKKDFKAVTFEHTPMSAALAQISQFEAQIVNNETAALTKLATDVGAADLKFDDIKVMVRPKSQVVAAGAKYEAEMFIAASSSAVTPTMKKDGKDIKVENGMGMVEFTATPGKYDKEGLAKKTYKAEINIAKPGGGDTTYVADVEYFVAKPVIQIQSASVQALYLGCGNELQVNVPALGTSYNPNFNISGGKHYKGKNRGQVTIVPNAKQVSMTVSSGGNRIGTEKFKVKPVPKPTIEVFTRGKPVNQKKGENISNVRSISIKAIPEEGFAALLPKDARYRVTNWTITLARGPRPVGSPITAKKQDVNLSSLMRLAKPGDRLSIEVKTVKRNNFRNEKENSAVNNKYFTIPLN
ncbi:gliding motility protein GldM [Fulvivirgaceae bacterium BMA12]|uniref:Gliding motility protein GldM n=1 Tax=Agaribacillus aureus TaxID=3051825 RepID=A0ABT8LFI3_9BACT|nr:gliding motility protein GldM [Fulvivirgaceae bacterium BMA12]